jgi:hypothetical protein
MGARLTRYVLGILLSAFVSQASAQTVEVTPAPPAVLQVSGTLVDGGSHPLTGPVSVAFKIYAGASDGAPVWQELQSVTADARGRFTAMLGSATPGGIPAELFASSDSRWLAVQADGHAEQPRFLFTSVAYALKAGDANTLGGLPASAFRLNVDLGAKDAAAGATPASRAARVATRGDGAEPNASTIDPIADQVIPDDLIVQASLCVGFDCINNEAFGDATIKLKENNLRIRFEDTSVGVFATTDWTLTANDAGEGGANFFGIDDSTAGTRPFRVNAGAPTNSVLVQSNGKVGLRVDNPLLDIHMNTGDTPAIRLAQDNTGGFTPQTWDVAGNEANFFVRDLTGGQLLPFRIRPGAPTSSLDISSSGNVAIGQSAAPAKLTIVQDAAMSWANSGGTERVTLLGSSANYLGVSILGSEKMRVNSSGRVGVGVTSPPSLLSLLQDESLSWSNPGGTARISLTGSSANSFSLNVLGSEKLRVDSAGNVGIGTSAPAHPLHMGSGAHVTAGGVWTNASSRALKDRVETLSPEAARSALMALEPVTFFYTASPTEQQAGFIAEDVPELVATNDRKSLSAMDVVAVVTRVVKSQQQRIEEQARQIDAQQSQIDALLARLQRLEAAQTIRHEW